jgi:hypothetical protein
MKSAKTKARDVHSAGLRTKIGQLAIKTGRAPNKLLEEVVAYSLATAVCTARRYIGRLPGDRSV